MKSTKLLNAIKQRDVLAIRKLVAAGANLEKSWFEKKLDRARPSPLLQAISSNSIEVVALLLELGADPNREVPSWGHPLAVACYGGHYPVIEELLRRGANINQQSVTYGCPIEQAAWTHNEELVDFLLTRGADPNPVLRRPIGSVLRVKASILARLVDAGGECSPEVQELIEGDRKFLSRS
jgi:ankyrin repeat protein